MKHDWAACSTLILALAAGCRAGSGDQPAAARAGSATGEPAANSAAVATVSPGPRRGAPCDYEGVSESCADSVERLALDSLTGWSRPTLAERIYRPIGGEEVRFRDDTTPGEGYVAYRLMGRLPGTHYAVVSRSEWESHDYLLVGESGDTAAIEGWPVVAPDGQRLAVASFDFDACYQSNRLEIWRVSTPSPVREYAAETGDCAEGCGWGPSNLVWTDSLTLAFSVHQAVRGSIDAGPGSGTLTRGEAGWTLSIPGH